MQLNTRERGFTLLELMIALSISVLIGIAAHVMLQSVSKAKLVREEHAEALNSLQKSLWFMTQDLTQMNPHSLQTGNGETLLNFIRKGWPSTGQMQERGLMHVSYTLSNGKLERRFWPLSIQVEQPQVQLLLDGISNISINKISAQAIEINLTCAPYGNLRKVIELPAL